MDKNIIQEEIYKIIIEYCDGTYFGLNDSSNFIHSANPKQIADEIILKVIELTTKER